jgi:hypothetical protein
MDLFSFSLIPFQHAPFWIFWFLWYTYNIHIHINHDLLFVLFVILFCFPLCFTFLRKIVC